MSLRAIVQLHYTKKDPKNGCEYTMVGGLVDGDENHISLNTPYGNQVIARDMVADMFLITDGLEVDTTMFPHVWFMNDINA